MTSTPSTVIVGVGNTLMQDDGVGVWALRALAEQYSFPNDVRLIEGGVLGLQLLDDLRPARQLLIIDAMNGDGAPGELYQLDADRLPKGRSSLMSLHEVGLSEILSVGELIGWCPRTRILGIQPLELRTPGLELTPALQAALPRIVSAVIEELEHFGIQIRQQRYSVSFEQPSA